MNSRFGRILAGLVLLAACAAHAQNSYEPGYIVDDKLDTLKGFIQYRNWMTNPTSITFKAFPESQHEEKTIEEISSFFVHGERYERATVDKYKHPLPNEDLTFSAIPPVTQTTAFLLNVFHVEKSLYYLRDENDHTHLYIRGGKGEFVLLIRHRYMVATSSGNLLATLNRYRDQLENFLSDCPDVQRKLKVTTYSDRELQRLFEIYYAKCSDEKPGQSSKHERIGVFPGITAGVVMTSLRLQDNILGNMKFDPSMMPTAGITVDLVIPRTKKAASIFNELAYSAFRSRYLKEGNDLLYTPVYRYDLEYFVNASYVKLNNLVRYKFQGNPRLFVNAGVSNGFMIAQKNGYYDKKGVSPTPIDGVIMSSVKKYELGLLGGIGVGFSKLSAELRFESSEGISIYKNLKAPVKRFSLLLGYRF